MRTESTPLFVSEVPLFTDGSSPNLEWRFPWGADEKWRGLGGFAPHRGVGGGPQSGKIDIFGGFSPPAPKRCFQTVSGWWGVVPLVRTDPGSRRRTYLSIGEICCGGLKMADHVLFAKMAESHHYVNRQLPLIGDGS